jgi:hypothetical protein
MNLLLLGELGSHARGKTLTAAAGATQGQLPECGIAIAFGKEAQHSPDQLAAWSAWADKPGRVLVLVPPFQRGISSQPTPWEARRVDPLAGGLTELGRVLASERQHEIRGELVPAERVGGQMVTGTWRRHPAAGLFVVTALPLWSLLTLDHRDLLREWLECFLSDAGRSVELNAQPSSTGFTPSPDEWAMLLHLYAGSYRHAAEALDALNASELFRLEEQSARASMCRLQEAGLTAEGRLSESGRIILLAGPYATYARALEMIPNA